MTMYPRIFIVCRLVICLLVVVLVAVGLMKLKRHKPPSVTTVTSVHNVQEVRDGLNVPEQVAEQIASAPRGEVVEQYRAPSVEYVKSYEQQTRRAHKADKIVIEKPQTLDGARVAKFDKNDTQAKDDGETVNVYRISLKKEHKLKAGVLVDGGKVTPLVGYQAGRAEVILGLEGSHIKSGALLYTLKEW